MMPSSLRIVVRNIGLAVVSIIATAVLSLMMLTTRAEALSISVGTPSVVADNITVDSWYGAVAGDNRVHVVYSTSNSSIYTIMFASNVSGGGYEITTLSTGALANKPLYLKMVLDAEDDPHVYWYDASSKTINNVVNKSFHGSNVNFLLGTEKVTATGLSLDKSGSGFGVLFSSLNAAGTKYDLIFTSATFGATSDTIDSNAGRIKVVFSTYAGNVSAGVFTSFLNSTNQGRSIVYYDGDASALKILIISPTDDTFGQVETIDTGVFTFVYGFDASNVSRIVYTDSSLGAKYAVQRRLISMNAWYIQKIDDGSAQWLLNNGASDVQITYVKNSGLYVAKGRQGVYFDDFEENITNNQLGKALIAANVATGALHQSANNRVRGIFAPNSTGGLGLHSINWTALSGTIADAWGTSTLPSVRVAAAVSLGSGSTAKTLDPTTGSDQAGGITNIDGSYTINVASGADTITITASSSPANLGNWIIVRGSTVSFSFTASSVTTSTGANAVASAGIQNVNFIAISTPVISSVTVVAAGGVFGTTLPVSALSSTFTATSIGKLAKQYFPPGGFFRFVPTGASVGDGAAVTGTVANFSSTVTAFTSRHIPITSFNQDPIRPGAMVSRFNVTDLGRTDFTSIQASTSGSLPQSYDLIYSTIVLIGATSSYHYSRLSNAFTLTKMKIDNVVEMSSPLVVNGLVTSSNESLFEITSLSTNGPVFPRLNNGDPIQSVGVVYLTTNSSVEIATSATPTVPLTVIASTSPSIIKASGSIAGLMVAGNGFSQNTWRIRVSTLIDGIWHSAISNPITFSTPTITSVNISSGFSSLITTGTLTLDGGVVISTLSVDIQGTGFLPSGTTVFVTTHTTYTNDFVPLSAAGNANVLNFQVFSSTRARLIMVPKPNVAFLNDTKYFVRIGTHAVHDPRFGTNPGIDTGFFRHSSLITQSTWYAESAMSMGLTYSTPVITSIVLNADPSVNVRLTTAVANTRTYSLRIYAAGLQTLVDPISLVQSATVTFRAVDGSTATPPVDGILSGDKQFLTVTADFRGVQPGKFYNVELTSGAITAPIASGIRIASGTFTNAAVWVASMSVTTITTPVFADPTVVPNGTIFNSTHNVRVILNGVGLVHLSTIGFTNGTLAFTTTTLDSANVLDDGRNMYVTLPGTAGAGGFFKATEGQYTFTLSTAVHANLPNAQVRSVNATGSIMVKAATLNSAVTISSNAAFSPVSVASFVVTGTGLFPGATAQLDVTNTVSSLTMTTGLTGFTNAYTSGTFVFDLRTVTTTITSAVLRLYRNSNANVAAPLEIQELTSGNIAISSIPVIAADGLLSDVGSGNNIIYNRYRNGESRTYTMRGHGLSNGATVVFEYRPTSSDNASNVATDGSNILSLSSTTVTSQLTVDSQTNQLGTFTLSNKFMRYGNWKVYVATAVLAGASPYPNRVTLPVGAVYMSTPSSFDFTVAESSAPNAPTGLTAFQSADLKTVTLRWISPGSDGTINPLLAGSKFIVYMSSGLYTDGQFCAACFPRDAVPASALGGVNLQAFTTNYSFSNTWASYLARGVLGANVSVSTNDLTLPHSFSTTTVRSLVVTTQTLAIENVTVINSSDVKTTATGSTGNSSIQPGRVISATLSIDPGTKNNKYWFIVRAQDQDGNISPSDVIYTTVSATILATIAQRTTIDPNSTTVLENTDLGGGVTSGGSIPPGALDGSDTLVRTADTNPPTASNVNIVGGVAVDIVLDSGKTEFKKAITLSFTLTASALAAIQGVKADLVKVAFFNPSSNRWVIIADSGLDGGAVTARITHLTKFAVVIVQPINDLNSVTVYPNPYRPTLTTHALQKITIDQLPFSSDIKIYTLAGDRVRDLYDHNGDGSISWDGKNNRGEDVASGVYFALISGAGDKRTVKIAIQR